MVSMAIVRALRFRLASRQVSPGLFAGRDFDFTDSCSTSLVLQVCIEPRTRLKTAALICSSGRGSYSTFLDI